MYGVVLRHIRPFGCGVKVLGAILPEHFIDTTDEASPVSGVALMASDMMEHFSQGWRSRVIATAGADGRVNVRSSDRRA
jgi:hypothetical protein